MPRGSNRSGKLFASLAALALLGAPIAGCDDGGPDEAFEEMGDELEDAGDELE